MAKPRPSSLPFLSACPRWVNRPKPVEEEKDDLDIAADEGSMVHGKMEDLASKPVINVGAATESEMKEKKARVEDALHATRAAVEEGIVPGGGVALIRAMAVLDKLDVTGEEKIGVDIVRKACEFPMRKIAENAGVDGSIVVQAVRNGKGNYGYDALKEVYCDMVKAGIIDPTKVTRTALQNASSIASLLLTTECMISELPEKKEAPAMPQGGGMGGMDY
jgi:chaperonin GroEL